MTAIQNKSATPLDILHAFQAKIIEIQTTSGNSGMCEFIKEAENEARQLLDKPTPNDAMSPLYGIPISIKELLSVRGYDCTFGLIKLTDQPKSKDCVVIRVLRKAGAIPFVLSATSQLALTTNGYNPIFGEMHNPVSEKHEPGGSSAGEGILIRQGGSPVGIGTDLLGSIRIPSAFCGICGFKPTATRISTIGVVDLEPRNLLPPFRVAVGPMGKRVDDLVRVMQVLFDSPMSQMDPTVPPIPFNRNIYEAKDKKSLVVGYYVTMDDPDLVQTVPSVRRAVARAAEIVKRNGHRVIAFSPPRPLDALRLILRAVNPDGGQAASRLLDGEPLSDHTQAMRDAAAVPDVFRTMVDAMVRNNVGAPAAWAKMMQRPNRPQDLLEVMYQLRVYQREFLQSMDEAGHIDALICPVWAYPAYEKNTPSIYVNSSVIYTGLYNALDFPAGSVPMGQVTEDDVERAMELAKDCGTAKDRYHEYLLTMQSGSIGLPLAVQVVGKPYQDETVLRLMHEIEMGTEVARNN